MEAGQGCPFCSLTKHYETGDACKKCRLSGTYAESCPVSYNIMGSGESQEKGLIVRDKITWNGTAENLSCLPTILTGETKKWIHSKKDWN